MYSQWAALALPLLAAAQTVPANNCTGPNAIHFISVRGHGGGNDPNAWNVLDGLRRMVLTQIPGSDAIPLPYDYNNAAFTTGIPSGRLLLQSYIQDYVASCPTSYIGLLGFSEGAMVAMDTICGSSELGLSPSSPLDSKYAKNVIAITTYGDETRVSGQPWNMGNCTSGNGLFPRMNNKGCDAYGAGIASYCDIGDTYCCYPGTTDYGVHAAYRIKYNQNVVNFFKARIAAHNSGNTTTTAPGRNILIPANASPVPTNAPTGEAIPQIL